MRRKQGALIPLEVEILRAGYQLNSADPSGFHGFGIAQAIAAHRGAHLLTAHGTLYKALRRLEHAGLLTSQWEDPSVALTEGRPRRRLYKVTGEGAAAFARHAVRSAAPEDGPVLGLSPTT